MTVRFVLMLARYHQPQRFRLLQLVNYLFFIIMVTEAAKPTVVISKVRKKCGMTTGDGTTTTTIGNGAAAKTMTKDGKVTMAMTMMNRYGKTTMITTKKRPVQFAWRRRTRTCIKTTSSR